VGDRGTILTIIDSFQFIRGFFCCSKHDKPLAYNKNRYGLIRSPCRIPLVGIKESISSQFTFTAYLTKVTHLITIFTQLSLKLNLKRTPLR
jgi:hypothetical protein